jgi:hypothetical protein
VCDERATVKHLRFTLHAFGREGAFAVSSAGHGAPPATTRRRPAGSPAWPRAPGGAREALAPMALEGRAPGGFSRLLCAPGRRKQSPHGQDASLHRLHLAGHVVRGSLDARAARPTVASARGAPARLRGEAARGGAARRSAPSCLSPVRPPHHRGQAAPEPRRDLIAVEHASAGGRTSVRPVAPRGDGCVRPVARRLPRAPARL